MGMVGLSEVMESWKIMATSLPRTSRICFSLSLTRSRPLSLIDPPTMWPPLGSSLMIDSPVMDLPQPDSPTRPRVSPAPMARLTLPTAWTTERDSLMWVERSSTSITGAVACRRSSGASDVIAGCSSSRLSAAAGGRRRCRAWRHR